MLASVSIMLLIFVCLPTTAPWDNELQVKTQDFALNRFIRSKDVTATPSLWVGWMCPEFTRTALGIHGTHPLLWLRLKSSQAENTSTSRDEKSFLHICHNMIMLRPNTTLDFFGEIAWQLPIKYTKAYVRWEKWGSTPSPQNTVLPCFLRKGKGG